MENTAIVMGKGLPISTRHSVEICNFIKNRTTEESKKLLEGVIAGRIAVPFKRYNKNVGHRKGKIASGRYPKNASESVLKLVKSVEANAKHQGMNLPLIIEEAIANKAVRSWHHGRIRRIKTKRTHIKLLVKEFKQVPIKEKKDELKKKEANKK